MFDGNGDDANQNPMGDQNPPMGDDTTGQTPAGDQGSSEPQGGEMPAEDSGSDQGTA